MIEPKLEIEIVEYRERFGWRLLDGKRPIAEAYGVWRHKSRESAIAAARLFVEVIAGAKIEIKGGETPFDPEATPIWDAIAQLGESIPEEDWNKVPIDLAANLDHYLYGARKEGGK